MPPKPSYARLVVFGLVGALAASGVAVLLALQLAKPDIPTAAFAGEPRASDAPEPPPAVEGLRAARGRWKADPDSWRVSLSWRPAEGAVRYLVSRDGRPLDEVTEPGFVDESVTPEGLYRYQVVAVDVDSDRSPPSRVRVVTGSLPKAAARVQGRWILRLKIRVLDHLSGWWPRRRHAHAHVPRGTLRRRVGLPRSREHGDRHRAGSDLLRLGSPATS